MNWQDIKVSADNSHFLFDGKQIFGRKFIEVLKFHSPGLAPVKDKSGSYHIDSFGNQLYVERFARTFGFYCNRAAVVQDDKCFHITDTGKQAYKDTFAWTGNFQENFCSVRNSENKYFHIDLDGNRIYNDSFLYCGDFKDGIACVKTSKGLFRHIYSNGKYLHDKEFSDLGIYHKNFAIAKDNGGWYHIDKSGNEIYRQRFLAVEPFYNGFALVTQFDNDKIIIDENGNTVVKI
jgi:hypothetical protein